jgi:hypothetical protein
MQETMISKEKKEYLRTTHPGAKTLAIVFRTGYTYIEKKEPRTLKNKEEL